LVKRCSKCAAEKPPEAFVRNSKAKDGLYSWCRECHAKKAQAWRDNNPELARERNRTKKRDHAKDEAAKNRWRASEAGKQAQRASHLRHTYGLTPEQFTDMVLAQGGHCAICGRAPKRLMVDHDHATGRVRGLLCGRCNSALGTFGDTVEGLMRAVAYLQASG